MDIDEMNDMTNAPPTLFASARCLARLRVRRVRPSLPRNCADRAPYAPGGASTCSHEKSATPYPENRTTFIVDNRPGGVQIGLSALAKSPPTAIPRHGRCPTCRGQPLPYKSLPFYTLKALTLSPSRRLPFVLVVHPKVPAAG